MGCVFGKELNAKKCAVEREGGGGERRREVEVRVAKAEENEVCNGENEKGNNNDVVEERRRREKRNRSSKPNPRLGNAPKHIHGEQVAAGWPSWLSAVAGEAINGWTPRRADTFEKLDKVHMFLLLLLLSSWLMSMIMCCFFLCVSVRFRKWLLFNVAIIRQNVIMFLEVLSLFDEMGFCFMGF